MKVLKNEKKKKRFGVENHRYRANMKMKLKASSCFFHVWLVVMAEKKWEADEA